MICRGLMLGLHRAGHIRLPEKKSHPKNPFVDRKKPAKVKIDQNPVNGRLCSTVLLSIIITWAIAIRSASSSSTSFIGKKDRLPACHGLLRRGISAAGTSLSAGRHTAEKRISI
jgi:hypothetical protein